MSTQLIDQSNDNWKGGILRFAIPADRQAMCVIDYDDLPKSVKELQSFLAYRQDSVTLVKSEKLRIERHYHNSIEKYYVIGSFVNDEVTDGGIEELCISLIKVIRNRKPKN